MPLASAAVVVGVTFPLFEIATVPAPAVTIVRVHDEPSRLLISNVDWPIDIFDSDRSRSGDRMCIVCGMQIRRRGRGDSGRISRLTQRDVLRIRMKAGRYDFNTAIEVAISHVQHRIIIRGYEHHVDAAAICGQRRASELELDVLDVDAGRCLL